MIHKNVKTDFSQHEYLPVVDASAFIHPLAAVIGNVTVGKRVMISPFASVRGDEGQPLFIGDDSNVQDGVIIHALETEQEGIPSSATSSTWTGSRTRCTSGPGCLSPTRPRCTDPAPWVTTPSWVCRPSYSGHGWERAA